jgi:hypothetical protein
MAHRVYRALAMDDIRFALRTLRKNPGFALVAVLAMGVGIGVKTTIFSVFNQMLLRPLPYPDASRLVFVWETYPRFGLERNTPAPGNFVDWRSQNHVFQDMAAFTAGLAGVFTRTGGEQPERLQGALVTARFFPLLGVPPAAGRTFLEEEDREGGSRCCGACVSALAAALWWRTRRARAHSGPQRAIVFGDRDYATRIRVSQLRHGALGSSGAHAGANG